MLFRLVRDPGPPLRVPLLCAARSKCRRPTDEAITERRRSGPSAAAKSASRNSRASVLARIVSYRWMITFALTTQLDDHFRSHYTESVLPIRYLSGEVSVGRRGDSFPENGRYTVDGVDARIIYTRKSTPSPVLFQPSIQVLMKKE